MAVCLSTCFCVKVKGGCLVLLCGSATGSYIVQGVLWRGTRAKSGVADRGSVVVVCRVCWRGYREKGREKPYSVF